MRIRTTVAAALVFFGVGVRAGLAAPRLTTVVNFNGYDGAYPLAGLIADAAGNLYGTTREGGANGYNRGTVYKVSSGGSTANTLLSFDVNVFGAYPTGGLVLDADGYLYGTAFEGGLSIVGTVFMLPSGEGSGTDSLTWPLNSSLGGNPMGGLVADAGGNLYGTTRAYGPSAYGTVFVLDTGRDGIRVLASFDGGNGANPLGGVIIDAAGNLYGTTRGGGPNGNLFGTVFKVPAGGGDVITLASFNGPNGATPEAGLILDADGNLYGTTRVGGANNLGTVFKVPAGGGEVTTLATFDGANGANPVAELIADAAGNLYGTTFKGGANDLGTVFMVPAGGGSVTTLVTFDGGNGANPVAGLLADAGGNLFGTASKGGRNDIGTVFKISDAGFVVVPEPGSLGLCLPALALLTRRRR